MPFTARDEQDRAHGRPRRQLLSATALSKLLYDWLKADTPGAKPAVPISVCQRLAQTPQLHDVLEYIVLHTVLGEKAGTMRQNLRLMDPAADTNVGRITAQVRKLRARCGDLAHLVANTRREAERRAEEVRSFRETADKAAVEVEVQTERLASLRRQGVAYRALAAVAAEHTTLQRSCEASMLELLARPPSGAAQDLVHEVLNAVHTNTTGVPADIAAPATLRRSVEDGTPIAAALDRLAGTPCTAGREVLSLVLDKAAEAAGNMQNAIMSRQDEEADRQEVAQLQGLVQAGHANHMRGFVREEKLAAECDRIRRDAARTCMAILARADHQSALSRQLSETQARIEGARAQKRALEGILGGLKVPRGDEVGMRGIDSLYVGSRGELDERRRRHMGAAARMLDAIEAAGDATTHGGVAATAHSVQALWVELEQRLRQAGCGGRGSRHPAAPQPHGERAYAALPGTGHRLLDTITQASTRGDAAPDSPVHSVPHNLQRVMQLVNDRAGLMAKERDYGAAAQALVAQQDFAASEARAAVDQWQDCVSRFTEVVLKIKETNEGMAALEHGFPQLSAACQHLRHPPAELLQKSLAAGARAVSPAPAAKGPRR